MTEPYVWTNRQAFRLLQQILHDYHRDENDGLVIPVQRHTRVRIGSWGVDIVFGDLTANLVTKARESEDEEERFVMMVMMFPQGDNDWHVTGKLHVTWPKLKHFIPVSYENDSFKLFGSGPSLDALMMRGKLCGIRMDEQEPKETT